MEFSPVMTSFVHHPVSSVFMTPETPTSHRSLMNGFQRMRQGTYSPNLFCTPSPVSLSPVSHGVPQYTNFQYPLYFNFNHTPSTCDKVYLHSTPSSSPRFTENIPKRDLMTPPPVLTAELPFDDSMEYSDDEDDFGPPPLLAGHSCPPKPCKPLKFSVDYLLS
ncbi:unnamed protein product [Auanema sp. JU1783]|nr:unnamed protein product [Auanema sp. JU1783]